jgi:hypothetical protein
MSPIVRRTRTTDALRQLAERPGTPAEGRVAREMLDREPKQASLDLDGFMQDMDLYFAAGSERIQ